MYTLCGSPGPSFPCWTGAVWPRRIHEVSKWCLWLTLYNQEGPIMKHLHFILQRTVELIWHFSWSVPHKSINPRCISISNFKPGTAYKGHSINKDSPPKKYILVYLHKGQVTIFIRRWDQVKLPFFLSLRCISLVNRAEMNHSLVALTPCSPTSILTPYIFMF